jgi:hypothetical protein
MRIDWGGQEMTVVYAASFHNFVFENELNLNHWLEYNIDVDTLSGQRELIYGMYLGWVLIEKTATAYRISVRLHNFTKNNDGATNMTIPNCTEDVINSAMCIMLHAIVTEDNFEQSPETCSFEDTTKEDVYNRNPFVLAQKMLGRDRDWLAVFNTLGIVVIVTVDKLKEYNHE